MKGSEKVTASMKRWRQRRWGLRIGSPIAALAPMASPFGMGAAHHAERLSLEHGADLVSPLGDALA
jgi:hypothetical protein